MNWIIILFFCVTLLLALRNQHAELQKQLTCAANELESLKQKNQELAQQSVTSKQCLQILGNQSESQNSQEC